TDSGLGGLLICAGLERRLRATPGEGPVRLVYVNAWPDAHHGYNDLPDMGARAAVFDRALAAMTAVRPDLLLIACNTLSVVYEATAFSRAPSVPVTGILDEGAALFAAVLGSDPTGLLALFGTRTTIGSAEHVRRLARRGISPERIVAEACHGLAAAIDKDPDSPRRAGPGRRMCRPDRPPAPARGPLYAGLACTHYGYVAEVFRASLVRHTGRTVEILDPAERLVDSLTGGLRPSGPAQDRAPVSVQVVSKVALAHAQRQAVARRLEPLSPATAGALLQYEHRPDLF
ncbi:MAG: aspartate/glutamate racemase family protein, partial [Candidatus Moduliflexus flocculans]|nr:aspartate/glutamate racemase family protein [Candidatus Moduliflexus flocculans]